MFVIYALVDPTTTKVHYVGMATDIYRRLIQHLRCEDNNSLKNAWIDGLRMQGIAPTLTTLEVVHTEQVARERETYWIQHYVHLGAPLTNVSQLSKVRKYIKHNDRQPFRSTRFDIRSFVFTCLRENQDSTIESIQQQALSIQESISIGSVSRYRKQYFAQRKPSSVSEIESA